MVNPYESPKVESVVQQANDIPPDKPRSKVILVGAAFLFVCVIFGNLMVSTYFVPDRKPTRSEEWLGTIGGLVVAVLLTITYWLIEQWRFAGRPTRHGRKAESPSA